MNSILITKMNIILSVQPWKHKTFTKNSYSSTGKLKHIPAVSSFATLEHVFN